MSKKNKKLMCAVYLSGNSDPFSLDFNLDETDVL